MFVQEVNLLKTLKEAYFAKRVPTRLGAKAVGYVAKLRGAKKKAENSLISNPNAAKGNKNDWEIPLETRVSRAEDSGTVMGTKRAASQRRFEEEFPKPTTDEVIDNKAQVKAGVKTRTKSLEQQNLKSRYGREKGDEGYVPLVSDATNFLLSKGFNEPAIIGTLGGLTAAPFIGGAIAYNKYTTHKDQQDKQGQAEHARQKAQEIIARRNLIREQRQIDPDSLMQQKIESNKLDLEAKRFDLEQRRAKAAPSTPEEDFGDKIPYKYSFSTPLVSTAEFIFGFNRKPKPDPVENLKRVAGIGVAGYGLLAGINKKRNDDALRINKIKDKEDRQAALEYYNSGQYTVDNVLGTIPSALGLSDTIAAQANHPLITPPKEEKERSEKKLRPSWTNYRTQAIYTRGNNKKTADFFLPLIAPVIGIAGAGYGLYRKRKEAKKKDEILQAEQLAALDRIQDPELRAGLLSKARGQLIDDQSRSQLVDAALSGDYRSALSVGLKKINFDNK